MIFNYYCGIVTEESAQRCFAKALRLLVQAQPYNPETGLPWIKSEKNA